MNRCSSFVRRFRVAFSSSLLLVALYSSVAAERSASPVPRAHAHNDYLHERPLLDALAHGFWSVEADVWLTNKQLLVAHDFEKVVPSRTLQSLYLDPLRAFVKTNAAAVARNGTFTLLIDVKSEAEPAYAALRDVLRNYADVLTRFESNAIRSNAVIVIISGNRAPALMEREPVRFAAVDGRLPDLETNPPPSLFPLVSDNWTKEFQWRGQGALPEAERAKLKQLVSRAHTQGRRIRFWAVPDNPSGWRELYDAGVDLLNTDNLGGMQQFLAGRSR
jgi:hypothetical protein